jgi:hypothetical protein
MQGALRPVRRWEAAPPLARYLTPAKALLLMASWSFIKISLNWAVTLRFLPGESSFDFMIPIMSHFH